MQHFIWLEATDFQCPSVNRGIGFIRSKLTGNENVPEEVRYRKMLKNHSQPSVEIRNYRQFEAWVEGL